MGVGREMRDQHLLSLTISDVIRYLIILSGIDGLLRIFEKWSGKTCWNLNFLDRDLCDV